MNANRPVFLDLWQIKLPASGIVSILHRVSGLLMVVTIPAAVALFGLSLSGQEGFVSVVAVLDHPLAKLALLLLAWSLLHHLLAGVRHLLLDLDIGLDRETARRSAWTAIAAAVAATALVAGLLL